MKKYILILLTLILTQSLVWSAPSLNIIQGGNSGTVITTATPEGGGFLRQTGSDTILFLSVTNQATTADTLSLRTYTISTDTWSAPSTIWSDGVTWQMFAPNIFIHNNKLYVYISKRLVANNQQGEITLMISTDLTGSSFGPENIIRAQQTGTPEIADVLPTSDPNTTYLVFNQDNTGYQMNLWKLSSDWTSITAGPNIWTKDNNYTENTCVYIGNHKDVCLLREGQGSTGLPLYEQTSANDGVNWTDPFQIVPALGSATGAKVTPRLKFDPCQPSRLIWTTYDRGVARKLMGGPTLANNAYNGNWLPAQFTGTANAYGNDDWVGYNSVDCKSMIFTNQTSGANNFAYWLVQDQYGKTKL